LNYAYKQQNRLDVARS